MDGAFGGVSPTGMIHMGVFTERAPFPRVVTHEVIDGEIGPEAARVSRDGAVREMEVSLVLSEDVARVLHSWLGEKVEQLSRLKRESAEIRRKAENKKKAQKKKKGRSR